MARIYSTAEPPRPRPYLGRFTSTPTRPSRPARSSRSSSSASTTPATSPRLAEYTPERDWQMGGGEAAAYGHLITEDLMPWIAAHYRVRTGREHTGVGGSSLGGLVSAPLFALRHPLHLLASWPCFRPASGGTRKSILGYLNERAPEIWERPRLWLERRRPGGPSDPRETPNSSTAASKPTAGFPEKPFILNA